MDPTSHGHPEPGSISPGRERVADFLLAGHPGGKSYFTVGLNEGLSLAWSLFRMAYCRGGCGYGIHVPEYTYVETKAYRDGLTAQKALHGAFFSSP